MFQGRFGTTGRVVRAITAAISSFVTSSVLVAVMLLGLLASWSTATQAQSACQTQTALINSGASTTFNMGPCTSNFGMDSSFVTTAVHGTVTLSAGNTVVTYTNWDDGATSDTFTLKDDSGFNVAYNITITPSNAAVQITPATLPTPVIGNSYSQTLSTTGGNGNYSYAITSGTLPAGLTLNNGVISGTPTATGTFAITVKSTDTTSPTPLTATKNYTMAIAFPTIGASPAGGTTFSGTRTIAFSQTISGANGTPPYTFSRDSGSFPAGLSINATTGVISGTPTAVASNLSVVVKVVDSTTGNGPYTGLISYTFNIVDLPPVPTATASSIVVPYNSAGTNAPLTLGGGTATAVTVVNAGSHGTATASGTTISYKPQTNFFGTDTFTYYASNLGGNSSPATVTVTVSPPPAMSLSPASGTSLSGQAGTAFTRTFTASGGSGSFSYSLSGALPNGLSFDGSTGVLSGTPTQANTYPITVTAVDTSTGNGPLSITYNYSLMTTAPSIIIAPTTLSALTKGVAITPVQLTASGGASPSYTYSATGVPTGLTLSSGGLLSGTPTVSGAYSITVTATDGYSFTGSRSYNGTIDPGVPVAGSVSANASYNNGAVTTTIPANLSGGTATSLTPGAAAHGTVTANGVTGFIYTPTVGYNGSDTFTYTASNAAGGSNTATVTITVAAPSYSVAPTSGGTLNATVGVSYSQSFTFTGGVAPYTYQQTGILPAGLVFDASSGTPQISGTPTQSGSYAITVKMTGDGSTGNTPTYLTASYTVVVGAPTLGITPTFLSVQPQVGVSYSQSFATTGGIAPYSYAITSGATPAGTSLTVSGSVTSLTGTPTTAGAYNFTITATDSSGNNYTAVRTYSGTVGAGKPVAINSSVSVGYNSGTTTITPSTTGGTPISVAVVTQASHGNVTISGTSFSYTPTAGYTGADSFVYTATNAVGTSAQATISITVGAPTLTITPSGAWSAAQNTAYNQTLTWSGGTAPYTFATVTGLPAGLSVTGTTASSMTISGSPTASGSFSVVVSGTDSTTPTPVTRAQTFTLTVNSAPPVAVADTASTIANAAVSIPVTNNDTGTITSIAIASNPSHGTAVVNGLAVTYTPATNYFGGDSFTYTASGAGATSAPATVSITVSTLPAPTSPPQTASVAPGQAVTLHVGAAATNGPVTSVALVSVPSSGTASVSGTDIIYTAAVGFSGTTQFTYTLTNAFGTSAPITATVNIGIVPVAGNQSASGAAGAPVVVNLMTGATGGPFTAANLGAIAPSTAGAAVISDAGTPGNASYRLTFTPAAAFSGTATVAYTLSNASGPSAAATVSITIAARPNVANDTQVRGVVAAHGETAARFATAQLGNFSRRLEALHGAGWARSSFGLGLTPPTTPTKPLLAQWHDDEADRVVGSPLQGGMRKVGWPLSPRTNDKTDTRLAAVDSRDLAALPELPGKTGDGRQELSLWIAGTVDFGHRNANGQQDGFRFTTNGVSMGADYRINDKFSVGVGTGYSRDRSDIGDNGSKSVGQNVVATVYGSVRPTPNTFIDGLLGYGFLSFDSTRYVTGDGSFATGQRSGSQAFIAVSGGYEFHHDNLLWSPYGKLDLASTTLGQYTESAAGSNALTYFRQRVRASSGTLGMRAEGQYLSRAGMWTPRVRVEYRRQFSGADEAGISYADQTAAGPAYVIRSDDSFTGNWTAGIGARLLMSNGMALIVDYSSNLNVGQGRYQSVLFGVNLPLK